QQGARVQRFGLDDVVVPGQGPDDHGGDEEKHHRGLRQHANALGTLRTRFRGESRQLRGRHDCPLSESTCPVRSCWMVSVTVVMSTVPTYSPREPVTTAFPPSARMASNASWSVDCVLTESPTGLPTVVSEDAAGRSRTCTQRFGLRRSSRTSAYVRPCSVRRLCSSAGEVPIVAVSVVSL